MPPDSRDTYLLNLPQLELPEPEPSPPHLAGNNARQKDGRLTDVDNPCVWQILNDRETQPSNNTNPHYYIAVAGDYPEALLDLPVA